MSHDEPKDIPAPAFIEVLYACHGLCRSTIYPPQPLQKYYIPAPAFTEVLHVRPAASIEEKVAYLTPPLGQCRRLVPWP